MPSMEYPFDDDDVSMASMNNKCDNTNNVKCIEESTSSNNHGDNTNNDDINRYKPNKRSSTSNTNAHNKNGYIFNNESRTFNDNTNNAPSTTFNDNADDTNSLTSITEDIEAIKFNEWLFGNDDDDDQQSKEEEEAEASGSLHSSQASKQSEIGQKRFRPETEERFDELIDDIEKEPPFKRLKRCLVGDNDDDKGTIIHFGAGCIFNFGDYGDFGDLRNDKKNKNNKNNKNKQ